MPTVHILLHQSRVSLRTVTEYVIISITDYITGSTLQQNVQVEVLVSESQVHTKLVRRIGSCTTWFRQLVFITNYTVTIAVNNTECTGKHHGVTIAATIQRCSFKFGNILELAVCLLNPHTTTWVIPHTADGTIIMTIQEAVHWTLVRIVFYIQEFVTSERVVGTDGITKVLTNLTACSEFNFKTGVFFRVNVFFREAGTECIRNIHDAACQDTIVDTTINFDSTEQFTIPQIKVHTDVSSLGYNPWQIIKNHTRSNHTHGQLIIKYITFFTLCICSHVLERITGIVSTLSVRSTEFQVRNKRQTLFDEFLFRHTPTGTYRGEESPTMSRSITIRTVVTSYNFQQIFASIIIVGTYQICSQTSFSAVTAIGCCTGISLIQNVVREITVIQTTSIQFIVTATWQFDNSGSTNVVVAKAICIVHLCTSIKSLENTHCVLITVFTKSLSRLVSEVVVQLIRFLQFWVVAVVTIERTQDT